MPQVIVSAIRTVRNLHAEGKLGPFYNFGWSGVNQLARAGALTVVVVLVTRHLGPSAYGSLAFGLSIVKIAAIAAGLGLDRIIVQQFVLEPQATARVIRHGLLLKGLAGFLMYAGLVLSLSVAILEHELVRFVVMIAGLAVLLQAFDTLDCLFQARGQLKLSFLGRTIPILLGSLLKVGAIIAGAGVLTFAALEAVEGALVCFGLVIVHWKTGGTSDLTTPDSGGSSSRTLLSRGLPLLISAVAVMIYLRSDLIMLGLMIGSRATGIYSAATQISEISNIIPMTVAPAVFPIILRAKERGAEAFQRDFLTLLQCLSLGAILIALLVTAGAPLIVDVLYGGAFADAVGVLRVHIWSVLFVFLGTAQTLWDAGERLYWLTCIRTVLGAICNVVLNLILIPDFGASGAAIATLVSYFVAGFVLNAVIRKTFPLFNMQLKALCLIPLFGWLQHDHRVNGRPSSGITESREL